MVSHDCGHSRQVVCGDGGHSRKVVPKTTQVLQHKKTIETCFEQYCLFEFDSGSLSKMSCLKKLSFCSAFWLLGNQTCVVGT